MEEKYRKMILTMAECNMCTSEAARQLYYHRNTFAYHLERIKEIYCLNPNNFYDLCKLVEMAKEG